MNRTTTPLSQADDTRTRIVEVAARLLQHEGTGAVTTRAVAHGAGVQAPAIYRLFGDKDGLLDAVAEHVMATYVSAKSAIVEAAAAVDTDPVDDLRAGWQMHIDFGLSNPALYALLSAPGREASPALQAGMDVLRARVARVASTGRLRVSERRAVDLIRAAGSGTVLTLLATPADQRDPALADDIYVAVLHQILTDAPRLRSTDPIAAAVALRAQLHELDVLSEAERRLMAEWLDRATER